MTSLRRTAALLSAASHSDAETRVMYLARARSSLISFVGEMDRQMRMLEAMEREVAREGR